MNGFDLPVTDPVLIFAIAMVIILLAPIAFERIRIPGIVGLIVSAAVVGPSALGLLERSETFVLLGTVGLIYLMFTAGLTLDLNQFERRRSQSIVFGLISFSLPALLAFSTVAILGNTIAQAFLVAAVVGSHTLLAYPIVQRLGIGKNLAVTMTMGGTMVTDIVSLTTLAVVVASVSGTIDLPFWIRFVGLVAIYVAGVVLLLPRLGRWFFRTVRKQPDVEFVFLMAVLFTGAYLAELAGLASIIGAFVVGLIMNRLVPPQSPLMTRISFIGDALFIPFFLLSVGLLVDLRILVSSLEVWGITLLITSMVVIGKGAAALISRFIYKLSPAEGWLSFGLSTPQAAATLAVTLLGFEIGLLDEIFVNAVVVMILLTSLLGPWVVERYGRRIALEEEMKPFEPSEAPQRILVPLANPQTADELVQIAMMLRNPASTEPIYPLTVTRDDAQSEERVAQAEKMLSHAVIYAAAADVPVNAITRIDFNIAAGIARAVKELRISTIVIGWAGDGTARSYIFGNILDQLLEETREMVIVCKMERPVATSDRLLLAIPPYAEREPGFGKALGAVKAFAEQSGSEVVVVTTGPERDRIDEFYRRTPPDVPTTFHIIDSWGAIIRNLDEIVEEGDMIVLMTVREGSVAWRSTLNRLPSMISRRFPKVTLLTQYLSETEGQQMMKDALADRQKAIQSNVDVDVAAPTVVLDLEDDEDIHILRALMHEADPEVEDEFLDGLLEELASKNPDYSPELQPGAAFYHVHSRAVLREQFIIGISRSGVRLRGTSRPAHLVMMLLVPESISSQDFLRRLTIVAQFVPSAEDIERLRNMDTREEVEAFIAERQGTAVEAHPRR